MNTGCHKCGNTNEWAGYLHGFCDACAKSILQAAQRKAKTVAPDKRLETDLARAQAAIAALATAESRHGIRVFCEPTPSPESVAALRQAIEFEAKRMTRALTDHRLLWSIYRRTDKTTPYYEAQPVAEPVSVTAEPEPEMVAA